jgi:L-serine dehydratase
MKFNFYSFAELAAIMNEQKIAIEDYAIKREAFICGFSENAVLAEIDRRIIITRDALERGLKNPQHSKSGLTKGAAVAFNTARRRLIQDSLYRKALSFALAINEVNACGGRIAAFPTAGSSGIVPGIIWAWWDTKSDTQPFSVSLPVPDKLRGAFLVAGLTGILISQSASLSGAEGGCQAECGSAGAMAACALAYLEGLSIERCFSAAALSLKNSLGLACDPVAGLVEVPCVKRNAFLAANVLAAVDLTLAGIESIIPFDEVVWAMKQISDIMPANLKENALGGLALTPTGQHYKNKILS